MSIVKIHGKIANVLSFNIEKFWIYTKHQSFVLWLNFPSNQSTSLRYPDNYQKNRTENITFLVEVKWDLIIFIILKTILSYENMNFGHNSRLNYITRTFSAGYRPEQEQSWLPSWSLCSGTTCTKQFNVLLCKVKSWQVHILYDCYNTGAHFSPGSVAHLCWEWSRRQQDYLAWWTVLEEMRVGV